MLIRVLGDLEVTIEDRQVDLGGAKPRALVGLLVAAEGRAVAIEQLIEEMWDGNPPGRVEASLQTYVARLRRALDPERTRLRTHPGGYSLRQDGVEVDAVLFAREVEAARAQRDPRGAVRALTSALAHWRGDAYAGLGSASLRAEAVRLSELRMAATEDMWHLRTDLGDHAEAVGALERLVTEHPLRERLWSLLARAQYLAARQGDALATLRRAREHLAEELGIDPGPALQALEQAILQQDPTLAPAPAAGPAGRSRPEQVVAPAAPADTAAIFGRDAALATAGRLVESVLAERSGRLLVVQGESGIGKTRLSEEIAERAGARGLRTGRGVWESEPCPPLWGWSRALGQVGIDAAALAVGEAHDATSVSFRQADQVLEALRGVGPALLVLDDVQWADGESLRLLRRLAAVLADVPVLLVLLARREAAPAAEVTGAIAALTRLGAERLELTGLDPAAVQHWVRQRTGVELPDDLAAGLVSRTEGNPFYLGELVRFLASGGALSGPATDGWGSVPNSVRDVVRQRLGSLEPGAEEVVTAAAVAGRSFDLAVVADAVGRPVTEVSEVAEALQVLGLVDEDGPGRFRFAHAIARDAVYEMLTGVAKARAHAAVGAAVEARHASLLNEHASELARHYVLAGPGYERSSWIFSHRAAEHALAGASYDEAVHQAGQAVELQDGDADVTEAEREATLLLMGRALVRQGAPVLAWAPVSRAATSALDRGDPASAARALLLLTENFLWGWRSHPRWDHAAIALWRRVLAAEPAVTPGERALLHACLAYELFLLLDDDELGPTEAEVAIRRTREDGLGEAERIRVLQVAVTALLRPGLRVRRVPLYDELVEIATRQGEHAALANTLTQRAVERGALGQLDRFRSDVVRARDLARRHGLPETLIVTGCMEALAREVDGDWDGAGRVLDETDELESTLRSNSFGLSMVHRAVIAEEQGRLADLEPVLDQMRVHHPMLRELHALALVRAGRTDRAREVLGAWREQPPIPRDYLEVGLNALRSRTWIALKDQEAVADLRARLAPYADELGFASAMLFTGSVRHTLGLLAAAAGDHDEARAQLEAAREVHNRLGLDLWEQRSRAALDALR